MTIDIGNASNTNDIGSASNTNELVLLFYSQQDIMQSYLNSIDKQKSK